VRGLRVNAWVNAASERHAVRPAKYAAESMSVRGAYPVERAAALSGVPRSTVHDWARKDVLVPTISAERTMLWSYGDLMGLRLVYWLRHPKGSIPAAPMSEVRETLHQLRARGRRRPR
jgi:hypothetical protein